MRLSFATVAAFLAASAPSTTLAQSPGTSDTFSDVIKTFSFAGCSFGGVMPCVGGFATFGVLPSGRGYGLGVDVNADFRDSPSIFPPLREASLAGPDTYFRFSVVGPRAECTTGRYVSDRCIGETLLGVSPVGTPDALLGQTVTFVTPIRGGTDFFGSFPGDPASFRVEGLQFAYKILDAGGPAILFVNVTSFTATPEPSTITLAAAGLLGFAGYGFRRRRGSLIAER